MSGTEEQVREVRRQLEEVEGDEEIKERVEDLHEVRRLCEELESEREKYEKNERKENLVDVVDDEPLTAMGVIESVRVVKGDENRFGSVEPDVLEIQYTVNPSEEPVVKEYMFPQDSDSVGLPPDHQISRLKYTIERVNGSFDSAIYGDIPLVYDDSKGKYIPDIPRSTGRWDVLKNRFGRVLKKSPLTKRKVCDTDRVLGHGNRKYGLRASVSGFLFSVSAFGFGWVALSLFGLFVYAIGSDGPFPINGQPEHILGGLVAFSGMMIVLVFCMVISALIAVGCGFEALRNIAYTVKDSLARLRHTANSFTSTEERRFNSDGE